MIQLNRFADGSYNVVIDGSLYTAKPCTDGYKLYVAPPEQGPVVKGADYLFTFGSLEAVLRYLAEQTSKPD